MRRRSAIAVALTLGTAGAAGAACSPDESPPPLAASVQQSTLFDTQRAVGLTVRPTGDEDLRIDTIQLSSPLFEPLAPDERDALVRAGDRAVVMPLRYGDARCGEVGEGPTELVAGVDGDEVRIAVEEHPAGLLTELHDAECAVAGVLEAVELRLGDRWERTAPRTVEGELVLVQRVPGVTAALERLEGNVIFTVRTSGSADPWLAVGDDRPSATGGLAIDASRCDPHARIEYKRTYELSAWVRVGDAEAIRVDIEAQGEARRALEEMLATCID